MDSNESKKEMAKSYEFADLEKKWLDKWLESDLFTATHDPGKPNFSIVIPPPNVTGVLHIGHALNNTLQDILVRYKRMDGFNALWVPGTDHAGIATQNVVERQLKAEKTNREELGREKFIERVWKWKAESGGRIIEQLKRLGCSCDWTRERFTLDEGLSKAVKEVFVRLYNEGLIYRGDYIINWCPRCHTALADIEVEHEPTDGKIWYMKYPLADGNGFITVATTRPETMLGDTGVAVNPDDPRYKDLVGKELILPLVNRKIPVIGDSAVDMEFGTGAVKVTPAHDFNDFEMALRHNLPFINIFDINAKVNENGGQYQGLDRYEARKRVVEDLETQDLLLKIEPHALSIGGCYRCKTIVEPRVSKQWFVNTKPLAKKALEAVINGETKILPDSWFRMYEEWMTNIKDWCISRQIWWGHRIPAWRCEDCGEIMVSEKEVTICSKCGSSRLMQETDVLDTWFSSALWPFSTLGWPDKTKDLEHYYPTSVLITSFDILFFWVARMMMMGIHFMDAAPFKFVYLHALVRDASGQKMSKSKGNVIDPLIIMDQYGTDAVRFTLAALAAQGRDIKLAEDRIEGYKHFVNKIWNATRLVFMNMPDDFSPNQPKAMNLSDKWILSRLNTLNKDLRIALDNFDFDVAARSIYSFFWHEFCDWYLELAKPGFNSDNPEIKNNTLNVSLYVLDNVFRLLHPFMPFVTEELWANLPNKTDFIMKASYPVCDESLIDKKSEEEMIFLQEFISLVRNARSDMGVHPGTNVKIFVLPHNNEMKDVLSQNLNALGLLARVQELSFITSSDGYSKNSAAIILKDLEAFMPIEGLVDTKTEIDKLKKEQSKILADLEKVNNKLSREDFIQRAKPEAIQKEKDKFADFTARLEKIEARIKMFEGISG